MRGASPRAALVAVGRAAAVEGTPRGCRAFLATVRGGCASSPALGSSVGFPSWLRWTAAEAAEAVERGGDAPPRISSAQRNRGVAHAGSLGSISVGLHAHRCVLGVSPPRCSRVSLASFSSRGGGGIDHVKLGRRIAASTTLREVLSEVRESHLDFRPRDAATACNRLAKHMGKFGQAIESDQDKATFQLAVQAAKRTASGMNSQEVSNTMWAYGTLTAKGVEVDAAAVRAVSEQAPRVAGEMIPQAVSNTLFAWSRFVENGIQLASILDESSWRAVVARTKEVWPQTTAQDRGMVQRAVNIITAASTAEETMSEADDTSPHPPPECAPAAFWAAAERWLCKLPEGKRAKLESNLSAAETDDAKRQLLVASVEADTTKVRATDKRAFLEVAAAELAKQ